MQRNGRRGAGLRGELVALCVAGALILTACAAAVESAPDVSGRGDDATAVTSAVSETTTVPPTTSTVPATTSTTSAPTTTVAMEPWTVVGVVIDLYGDLRATRGFTILTEEGDELVFVPAEDASFHGGPISHLRDHLVSGLPVSVDYTVGADGTLIATCAEDADHDH